MAFELNEKAKDTIDYSKFGEKAAIDKFPRIPQVNNSLHNMSPFTQ